MKPVDPLNAFVGTVLAGVGPAIGAAAADRRPVVGAVVGAAAANLVAGGLVYAASPLEPKESIWPYILTGTALLGTGGALGAAISDRRPALGAFIGAALVAGGGYVAQRLQAAPKSNGQISGVPCNALARVSAGAFP